MLPKKRKNKISKKEKMEELGIFLNKREIKDKELDESWRDVG